MKSSLKRMLSLVLALVLSLSLMSSAFAASSEAVAAANNLYSLGLFKGTGTNADGTPIFDLDLAPTRNEAVTMLVRLLGKEEEATSGTWSTPFTDVPRWAQPYVGYAYTNGLTNGTSATTYSGNETVSASQYLTFVLRSLGYEDGTDFTWNKAWELSDQIGLTNGEYNVNTVSFTRGDVAIISYAALSQTLKDKDTTLSETLPSQPETSLSQQYTYLAYTDFSRIKHKYSSAKATGGYVYAYKNLDGDLIVLTRIEFKIISNYSVFTLHNITQGVTTTDPESYYDRLADHAYGVKKIHIMNVGNEVILQEANMLGALVDIYQGKGNTFDGVYVSADTLNI